MVRLWSLCCHAYIYFSLNILHTHNYEARLLYIWDKVSDALHCHLYVEALPAFISEMNGNHNVYFFFTICTLIGLQTTPQCCYNFGKWNNHVLLLLNFFLYNKMKLNSANIKWPVDDKNNRVVGTICAIYCNDN